MVANIVGPGTCVQNLGSKRFCALQRCGVPGVHRGSEHGEGQVVFAQV